MKEGDAIVIEAELRRSESAPTLKELVAQITPEKRYEETEWGPERGKEIVEW